VRADHRFCAGVIVLPMGAVLGFLIFIFVASIFAPGDDPRGKGWNVGAEFEPVISTSAHCSRWALQSGLKCGDKMSERERPLIEILSRKSTPEDARGIMEFEKLRFELSWRYFDFHAKQRTQLFHFYIILMPFVLGGCIYLFKERAEVGPWLSFAGAWAGALLSLVFFGLDRRNRIMIGMSVRAIKLLEKNFLYVPDFRALPEDGRSFKGIMTTEEEENEDRWFKTLRRHATLVGLVYWMAFFSFVVLAAYIYLVETGHIKIGATSAPTIQRPSGFDGGFPG
jgi:hypothetical protein